MQPAVAPPRAVGVVNLGHRAKRARKDARVIIAPVAPSNKKMMATEDLRAMRKRCVIDERHRNHHSSRHILIPLD